MTKLGLPLEYKKLPEYFDVLNIGDNTDEKNGVIEGFLKKFKVETVLDVTCGTGSQVFFLNARGYQCTGSDFSPALLKIARKRARKDKLNLKFIDGDMRTLKVGQFDAVISIFNAVGHLTKAGFSRAMRNIHQNLNEGGIVVFDILNAEAMSDTVVAELAYCINKKANNVQVYSAQCSTFNEEDGRLTSYDNYMIQKNADKPERLSHKSSLQLYTAKELEEVLAKCGFEVMDQCGMDGSTFSKKKTTNILTVARKV